MLAAFCRAQHVSQHGNTLDVLIPVPAISSYMHWARTGCLTLSSHSWRLTVAVVCGWLQESTLLRLAERQAGREEELLAARQKVRLAFAVLFS